MEIHAGRNHNTVHDQENVHAAKGKGNAPLPVKRQGLAVRGALGDMNTNVQAPREATGGKVAVATAEFEKKATLNRAGSLRSNYCHVQSKIDTGLASKPASKPSLRREESTAGLAVKAVAQLSKVPLKDAVANTLKNVDVKQRSQQQVKTSFQEKENKKISRRLPKIKERVNEKESKPLKPIIKDPSECLGRLKLAEIRSYTIKSDSSSVSLPNDIEDIDAHDANPLSMSIYIKDIYKYLTELELLYPIHREHLAKQSVITGKMRATLIDWLVDVQHQFTLVLETFQLTIGILDRYLQASDVQRDRLQLIGITAMYIASKYEEIYSPNVEDFVYVTDSAYSKTDIFQCEREILSKLGFCLARPIPLSFLRRFVRAAHGTAKQHHLSKYFVDLSLVEYHMAHYRPSELAAAALCLSLYVLSPSRARLEDVWTPTVRYYSGYSLEHISPIIKEIAKIVVKADKAKNKSVLNKYSDTVLGKVAMLPQLKGDGIYELAGVSRETPSDSSHK